VLLAAALVLPFPAAGLGARRLCDHLARRAADDLWRGASLLVPDAPTDTASTDALVGIGDPAPVLLPFAAGASDGEDATAVEDGKAKKKPGAPKPPRGILIRAAVVARAVRSGARPSGVPVPPSGERPAGFAMVGVGGFGAGLVDGDVLTSVGGTSATSVGAVVGAVAGAVRSGARALGAVIWRGGRRIDVTVEIPRIDAR
jgi:hypothetical protein